MEKQDRPESTEKPRKWYHNYTFPLFPFVKTRRADYYNTSSFSFHWMFFQVWSLDSFGFEFAFVISDHWGIGLTAILPYLRIAITIPPHPKLGMWVQNNLWRRPATKKQREV